MKSKTQTTRAKMNRERAVKERRARKLAKKQGTADPRDTEAGETSPAQNVEGGG